MTHIYRGAPISPLVWASCRTICRRKISASLSSTGHSESSGLSRVLAAAEPQVFRVKASPTSFPLLLPSALLIGRDFSPASKGPRDTGGLERRAVLGVVGSCEQCLRDLGSLDGVRGGELGGSEGWLEEAMVRVSLRREG